MTPVVNVGAELKSGPYGQVNPEIAGYVDLCYKRVLFRNADAGGLRSYSKLIEDGRLLREDLPKLLRGSSEWEKRFGWRKWKDRAPFKEYFLDQSNPCLTYYAPLSDSFGLVAIRQMEQLPYAGFNAKHLDLYDMMLFEKGIENPIGLITPLFYPLGIISEATFKKIKSFHKHFVGVEVADSTAVSNFAVNTSNKMSMLIVPSECSKKAYVSSGVKVPVAVAHHGVNDSFTLPKHSYEYDKARILFFYWHSEIRKGADVVYKVMKRVLGERKNVRFSLRKPDTKHRLSQLPFTTTLTSWLNENELVKLYDSCDILLAPSRGGGFELNVLEGLARGLIVITSDWPAIQEFAGSYALTIKSTGRKVQPLSKNPIHTGYGADPDPEHFYQLINYALDNLESLKKKAEKNMWKIRERYSWKNTAKNIVRSLSQLEE